MVADSNHESARRHNVLPEEMRAPDVSDAAWPRRWGEAHLGRDACDKGTAAWVRRGRRPFRGPGPAAALVPMLFAKFPGTRADLFVKRSPAN